MENLGKGIAILGMWIGITVAFYLIVKARMSIETYCIFMIPMVLIIFLTKSATVSLVTGKNLIDVMSEI